MQRRDFIKLLGLAGTSAAAYAACSAYMAEALAQSASTIDELLTVEGECKEGSLADIEHVVFLMQENRSFDHYFGTLRGVRGFGDPRPMKLRNGKSVWQQSAAWPRKPDPVTGIIPDSTPYRMFKESRAVPTLLEPVDPSSAGGTYIEDPAHRFGDSLGAWNGGLMDQWIEKKKIVTMSHYTEIDIPLYFKLARAFTLCDAYHCAHNGGTDANRSIFFTGTCKGRTENDYFSHANPADRDKLDWTSYPEKLELLGVSWKFYQEGLDGNTFTGNYGDNVLDAFKQFQDKSTAIYKKNQTVNPVLRTSVDVPSQFEQDVRDNTLPAVSWIVAPEAFTEHPHFPPHFGEYYVHEILRAFTINKEVWKKTLFIINYDENGGFFDHVPQPVPPIDPVNGKTTPGITFDVPGTANSETSIQSKNPIGMGARVPALIISPWSTGGRVNSEVFDHTSAIRFLDKWLVARGLQKPDAPAFENLSSWRLAIAGDLTSTLDFKRSETTALEQVVPAATKARIMSSEEKKIVPVGWLKGAAAEVGDMKADPLHTKTALKQDRARCEKLPIAYDFHVITAVESKSVRLTFRNPGPLGTAFTVIPYTTKDKVKLYSVEGAKKDGLRSELSDVLTPTSPDGLYSYAIHGPNGYLLELRGNFQTATQQLVAEIVDIKSKADAAKIEFSFGKWNPNGKLTMVNAYTGETKSIAEGMTALETATADGWYDVAFFDDGTYLRRYAGRLENGRIGKSDPAIGMQYDEATRVYKDYAV